MQVQNEMLNNVLYFLALNTLGFGVVGEAAHQRTATSFPELKPLFSSSKLMFFTADSHHGYEEDYKKLGVKRFGAAGMGQLLQVLVLLPE